MRKTMLGVLLAITVVVVGAVVGRSEPTQATGLGQTAEPGAAPGTIEFLR